MKVAMKHPKTGNTKEVKVGWSWTLFLFSGFFGLPLFLRGLHGLGSVLLLFLVLSMLVTPLGVTTAAIAAGINISAILNIVNLGLYIFAALKGNEMTAKNYLENGWVFVEPDSESTKMAKLRWGINA